MDDAPRPSDPEIIAAERVCQEMRDIAKKLPKPDNTKEGKRIIQFGNNFFLLFLLLLREKRKPSSDIGEDSVITKIYLRRAEELPGGKWKKFLEENAGLVTQINKILEQNEMLSELTRRYVILLKDKKTLELSDKISEEISLQSIRVEIWDKLNPLLKQASEAMAQCGIKPKDFYS